MPLPITLALTKAGNQTLSVDEVARVIQDSEKAQSDANAGLGHALQHVQDVQDANHSRTTKYSLKRDWNELGGSGGHSCFKTERQQAELVRDALCSTEGKSALRSLNSGCLSERIRSTIGSGEDMVSQGNLGGLFGIFFDDKIANGIVVDIHRSGINLHVRSAYPAAD